MIPAARLQSAIELVAAIEAAIAEGGPPADRQVAAFFARRRYAGAKDRAAVVDRVYGVLRRRAELLWRLGPGKDARNGAAATGPAQLARRLVLAHLVLADGLGADEIAALFDGGRFAPAPLDEGERRLLAGLRQTPSEAPPGYIAGSYPVWLEDELGRRFGDDLVDEMRALNERAPLDLRVNGLKGDRTEVREALAAAGCGVEDCPYSPVGLRLVDRRPVTSHEIFRDGRVEIQDEGSQLVALIVDARPGMQVVDLCAGAGGKTLALAAAMGRRGQIYACDVDRRRLERMRPRLKRAGAHNVQRRHIASERDPWLAGLAGAADRVLVDAPCSGTGTWRRNPDARWRLTPAAVERHAALQQRLLAAAAPLVRPGGRLVYATCSLLPAEDEDQVDRFLAAEPGFRVVPVTEIWAEAVGGDCPTAGPYLLLTPRRHGVDGFFAAIFEREGAAGSEG